MIVCHCGVVSDRAVKGVVDRGVRTLSGVCRSTGAGQGCGACVFSLKRLICEHEVETRAANRQATPVPAVVQAEETTSAAS